MSDPQYVYRSDQELPTMRLAWKDGNETIIDYSSGFTATVKVASAAAPTTTLLTKTSGITLAATSPNYSIEWTAADFTTLGGALGTLPDAGIVCVVHAYVRRSADSKDDVFRPFDPPQFRLMPAPS
jgi:hypothetical protein